MKTATFHCTRTFWLGALAAVLAAGTLPSASHAQSQDNATPSVAEAARKAKEQKKNSAKDARVITEDTIKLRPASADSATTPPAGTVITTNSTASTEASPALTASPAASTAASTSAPPEVASTPAEKKEKSEEATKAKEMLAQVQAELDVLKRELSLDSDSYYSNPDYPHDAEGKAKLEELQKMIGDKQVSFDELKKQVEKLLQEAGISPDTDKTSAPPKN
jgi:hypothetical protein